MSIRVRMMRRIASKSTRVIGERWGESFPMYFVAEYPKSGGTWLCRLVADTLNVPFPQHTMLPLAVSCVVHNHWRYAPRLRRVFYISRDGRDVMTSFFFHRMRVIRNQHGPAWELHKKRYERLFGAGFDPEDTPGLLPRFIEEEFRRPRDARITWREHVESWVGNPSPHVAHLSYEGLLADGEGTLSRAIEHVTGEAPEAWRVKMALDKHSMQRATGRRPGQEDRGHFIRKGVAGDWRNHFTRAAAEVFDDLAGDTLVMLGYEQGRNWVRDGLFIDDPVEAHGAAERGARLIA